MGHFRPTNLLRTFGVSLALTLELSGCTSSSKAPEESSSSYDNGPLVSQRTTGSVVPFAPREHVIATGLYAPGSSTSVALWKTRATIGNRALSGPAEMSLSLFQGGGIAETADLQLVGPIVRFQLKNSDGSAISRESVRRDIVIESIVDRFVEQENIVALILFNFGKTNEERWLIESKHIQFQIAADQSRTIAFAMRDTDFVFTLAAVRPKRMPLGWRTFTPPPRDVTSFSTSTEKISDTASEVTLSWTPPEGAVSGYFVKTSYAPFESPACLDGNSIDAGKIVSVRQEFPEMKSDSYNVSGLLDGTTAYIQLCTRNSRSPADISEGLVITHEVPRRAKAEFGNAPLAHTNAASLNITISGLGLTSYKYALKSGESACENATYSEWLSVEKPIADPLAESNYVLCVLGKNSDSNVQKAPSTTSFQVDRTPPETFAVTAPTDILTSRKPEISWSAATGANSYEATVAMDSSCANIFKKVSLTAPKLSDTSIPDGTYYLCVIAKDAAGNSQTASGGSVSFTVDATPPGSFSISSPSPSSAVYTHTPEISWTTATGAATYTYIVSDNSACSNVLLTGQNVALPSHTLSQLAPGPYYLCVTAQDTAGNQTPALNSGLPFAIDTGSWGPVNSPGATLTNRSNPLYAWAEAYGKLLIWGGRDSSGNALSSGAMYDPADDSWQSISQTNSPSARIGSIALWSPNIMRLIVWGGKDGNNDLLRDGAFYEPGGAWTPIAETNAPLARRDHTAVLTDSSMIIWGGTSCSGTPVCGTTSLTNTGGVFHVASNTWQSGGTDISDPDTPSPRSLHTAIWTGSRMIIWGGSDGNPLNTGGRYAPGTPGEWTTTSTTNAPSPRQGHVATWTGSKMLVWGGYGCANPPTCSLLEDLNDGSLYDPLTDSWTPINGTGALSSRNGFSSAWDPSTQRLLIWGGQQNGSFLDDGGMISPADGWIVPRTNTNGAPPARSGSLAVWTGGKFIIYGGSNSSLLGDGASFIPP